VREAVRRGLPYSAFERCRDLLEMRREELAELLGVAPRTLARRKQARRLSPEESDRLYRVARMVGLAETVLGSIKKAKEWMRRPNRSLGGVTPLSLLDTGIGARSVEQVLGRLEHGIHG
jgi:putative toxin-antitoxin system antitoxin component (TIGR02293 family)